MSVNQLQTKKSRSAGPGGKQGTSNPGKTNVFPSLAAPKDSLPGSSDWVAAKKFRHLHIWEGGGSKYTTVGPSRWGSKGTIQDPEDFLALIPPAGSSSDPLDYEDAVDDQEMEVKQGHETPTDSFWLKIPPKSRSVGPGGKQGTSNPGKTKVSPSFAAPKDPPPGTSD